MGAKGKAGSGGARKIGRNEKKCQKYLSERRRIKNKACRMKRRVGHYRTGSEKILKHDRIGRRKEA